ncbi:hypothetical protein BCV70DRAFT_78595 [Testicularia cyperi]|uniref:Uncharacterized protein n=1 Tax=Testicularia cyperi TaxID=1882483 RepID=A0A317XTL6_9BASI|nr:hypothetical protein BCV70DRAFT_78595 [Testicularia cyperi]
MLGTLAWRLGSQPVRASFSALRLDCTMPDDTATGQYSSSCNIVVNGQPRASNQHGTLSLKQPRSNRTRFVKPSKPLYLNIRCRFVFPFRRQLCKNRDSGLRIGMVSATVVVVVVITIPHSHLQPTRRGYGDGVPKDRRRGRTLGRVCEDWTQLGHKVGPRSALASCNLG